MIFKYAHLSGGLNNVSIIGFCRKCAEQKLHPLSYTDGDMDSQRQQDQHKSQYVPHIICDSGLGAKMSVLFACLIKRVSKLPGERTKAHWDKSPLGQKPTGQYPTGQKPTA